MFIKKKKQASILNDFNNPEAINLPIECIVSEIF